MVLAQKNLVVFRIFYQVFYNAKWTIKELKILGVGSHHYMKSRLTTVKKVYDLLSDHFLWTQYIVLQGMVGAQFDRLLPQVKVMRSRLTASSKCSAHNWVFHKYEPQLKVMRQTNTSLPNLELGLYSQNFKCMKAWIHIRYTYIWAICKKQLW
jgi:hypothetical protein